MRKSISSIVKVAAAALTIGSLATPAMAQSWNGQDRGYSDYRGDRTDRDGRYDRDYRDRDGRYDRDYRDYRNDRDDRYSRWNGELSGSGVSRLHYLLKGSRSGQRFAMQFDRNRNGRLSMEEAGEANREFIRAADRNGDAHVTDREAARVL